MKTVSALITIIVILCIALVFGAQNEQIISLNFLIAQREMRVSTLIAFVLCIGAFLAFLALLPYIIKLKWLAAQASNISSSSKVD